MKTRTLAVVWMLVVLVGMSIPTTALPNARILTFDKLIHFGCFFVLTLLWLRALGGQWKRRAVVAFVVGVGYGAFTELYQGLTPFGRTADVFDLLADAAGCGAALLLGGLLFRGKENAPSNSPPFTVS